MSDRYVRSTSTTWRLIVDKIERPAGGHSDSAPKGHRWKRFRRTSSREWVKLEMKYQGGGSGWVVVRARGEVNPYPADTWILNLLMDITQDVP